MARIEVFGALSPSALTPWDIYPPIGLAGLVVILLWVFLRQLPSILPSDRNLVLRLAAGLLFAFTFVGFAQGEGGVFLYLLALAAAMFLVAAISLWRHRARRTKLQNRALIQLAISGSMGAILAHASGDAGGPDAMFQWFQTTFGMTPEQADIATIAFRKTVHFTFFGTIAGLALAAAKRVETPLKGAVVFALLWTAAYASFDEISQLASPARTGSAVDFCLDMLGAGTFVWLACRKG